LRSASCVSGLYLRTRSIRSYWRIMGGLRAGVGFSAAGEAAAAAAGAGRGARAGAGFCIRGTSERVRAILVPCSDRQGTTSRYHVVSTALQGLSRLVDK